MENLIGISCPRAAQEIKPDCRGRSPLFRADPKCSLITPSMSSTSSGVTSLIKSSFHGADARVASTGARFRRDNSTRVLPPRSPPLLLIASSAWSTLWPPRLRGFGTVSWPEFPTAAPQAQLRAPPSRGSPPRRRHRRPVSSDGWQSADSQVRFAG